ncbi:MMPL family transporter [Gymnodinialimonas sp.]
MTARIGMGLGLERLGLFALARPKTAGALVVALTLVLVAALPGLRFQGDILGQTDRQSAVWRDYETLRSDFALAMPHIYILADPPDTDGAIEDWLHDQRQLVLNLRLTPGVADVQSLFALREARDGGGTQPLIATANVLASVDDLHSLAAERPDVAAFLNPDGPVSRIAIVLDQDRTGDADFTENMIERISGLVENSPLSTQMAGASIVQHEISETLLRDMVRMIALSTLVGWSMGLLVFADFRAVLITNIISPVAMIWTAGFAAMTGQALNSITIVLPLLASIIAFADAIHLIVPLSKRLAEGEPLRASIATVVHAVGPATALTSMTTALAFGSLAMAGGGMVGVAWLGVAAVILAWLAVITLAPLLCLLLASNGLGTTRFNSARFQSLFCSIAAKTLSRGPLIFASAAGAGIVLLGAASQLPSEHLPSDYLPRSSQARAAEMDMERFFSGSLSVLVAMPVANTSGPLDPANQARLRAWQEALEGASEGGTVWSRARLSDALAAQLPENAPDLSADGDRMLLVVSHGWEETGTQSLARVAQMRTALAALPGGEGAQISGASTIVATTALGDIERLRTGLFLSIGLAAGLVTVLSRSLAAGIAVGLSVLLSSLVVLVGSAAWSGAVSYGLIVALIIAVGIAIDDGIHLVNVARGPNTNGRISSLAWTDALARTGGAVLVTSLILMVTLLVTQASSMPALRGIGREVILALAAAFVLTLTVIAPTAVFMDRLLARMVQRKAPRDA